MEIFDKDFRFIGRAPAFLDGQGLNLAVIHPENSIAYIKQCFGHVVYIERGYIGVFSR